METCCDPEEQRDQHEQDSPDDRSQTQFFQTPVPSEPLYFVIDEEEWTKLKTERRDTCFKGLNWTNVISEGIHSVFPYCSVGFKRHRLRRPRSRKNTPEFWCNAYCRFEGCPVTVTVSVASDLKATVTFKGGSTKHVKEHTKRRPIRAGLRKKLGEELHKTLPRALYLQRLKGLNGDVMDSGCRDDIPTPQILKNISYECRQSSRRDSNETISVQTMLENRRGTPEEVLQIVMMHPKGVFLWSRRGIQIYHDRCQEDVVYIDSTGSCLKKNKNSSHFSVYELIVRNPQKQKPPLPVATLVTCDDNITASVTYFLQAFLLDVSKCYGPTMQPPLMLLCDASVELMQTVCLSFTSTDMHSTMNRYYNVAAGKGTKEDFRVPILHRCRSHFMKDAEEMCRKYASAHYHLAMQVCALLTTASSLGQLDEMVQSAAVVFSSPCTGPDVKQHFNNLLSLMLKNGLPQYDDGKPGNWTEGLEEISWKNNFGRRYKSIIKDAPLRLHGKQNEYYCKGLMSHMTKHHLAFAGLWTRIMLGDLGRHGTGELYEESSKEYAYLRTLMRQNVTENNSTQVGQWDVKYAGFLTHRLTRMDDLICQYQSCHIASLREYEDAAAVQSLSSSFSCDTERKTRREGFKIPFSLLDSSDISSSCAMCSVTEPPRTGPNGTTWSRCNICERWFHDQCVSMDSNIWMNPRTDIWTCSSCS